MDPEIVAVIAALAGALGVVGKKSLDVAKAAIKQKRSDSGISPVVKGKKGANTLIVEARDREDQQRLIQLMESLEVEQANFIKISESLQIISEFAKVNDSRHAPYKIGDREEFSWKLSIELKRSMEKIPDLLTRLVDNQEDALETYKFLKSEQEVLNALLRSMLRER